MNCIGTAWLFHPQLLYQVVWRKWITSPSVFYLMPTLMGDPVWFQNNFKKILKLFCCHSDIAG
jgi:hypothetical protein